MKRPFSHLTLDDRRKIERWRHLRLSPDEMARRLGRHRSTIFRELRRNHYHDAELPKFRGYWGVVAQRFCDGRRHKDRKLVAYHKLLAAVIEKLRIGWTPEQITGRMTYEGLQPRCSEEPIYRHIYSDDGRAAQPCDTYREVGAGGEIIACSSGNCPSFQPNSASCSALMRSPITASSGIGNADLVLFCQKYRAANVRRWSNA